MGLQIRYFWAYFLFATHPFFVWNTRLSCSPFWFVNLAFSIVGVDRYIWWRIITWFFNCCNHFVFHWYKNPIWRFIVGKICSFCDPKATSTFAKPKFVYIISKTFALITKKTSFLLCALYREFLKEFIFESLMIMRIFEWIFIIPIYLLSWSAVAFKNSFANAES